MLWLKIIEKTSELFKINCYVYKRDIKVLWLSYILSELDSLFHCLEILKTKFLAKIAVLGRLTIKLIPLPLVRETK